MSEFTFDRLQIAMSSHGVPDHLRPGFTRYVLAGVPTGGGIRRILEDRPVSEVIAGLDDSSALRLRAIWRFIYLDTPPDCHGSPAAVAAWIKRGGTNGPQEGRTND